MIKRLLRIFIVFVLIIGLAATSYNFYNSTKSSGGNIAAKSSIFSLNGNSNVFNVVLLGDSLAKGTGDEKGEGIATYLPEEIKNKTNKKVSIYNTGVNGLKSDGLLEELRSNKLNSSLASCSLIILSIGGNDILSLQHVEDKDKYEAFIKNQQSYQQSLKGTIVKIRELNPVAFIVVIGLYNPRQDAFSQLNSMILGIWNRETQKIIESDDRTVFVPTSDIFKSNLDTFISSDSLHPNSDGYKAITKEIISYVENK